MDRMDDKLPGLGNKNAGAKVAHMGFHFIPLQPKPIDRNRVDGAVMCRDYRRIQLISRAFTVRRTRQTMTNCYRPPGGLMLKAGLATASAVLVAQRCETLPRPGPRADMLELCHIQHYCSYFLLRSFIRIFKI